MSRKEIFESGERRYDAAEGLRLQEGGRRKARHARQKHGESRCRRLDALGRSGSLYRSAMQRKNRRLSLTYYLREVQGLDQQVQIWKITDDEAVCLFPTRGSLLHYRRESGETIWDAIRRQGGWGRPDVHELKVAPGHYYPRIARPMIPTPPSFAKQRAGNRAGQTTKTPSLAGC